MKVLFVDDDPMILVGFERALRHEPYDVRMAVSPAEALGILESEVIDVVVSDEHMPGGSGWVFLARVRELYPDTIRMMLTGGTSLDIAVRAINEGKLYRFLNKPIKTAELAETMRNAINLKQLRERANHLQAIGSGFLRAQTSVTKKIA